MGPAHQALSVTFGDSSPRGRAKSVGPAALDGGLEGTPSQRAEPPQPTGCGGSAYRGKGNQLAFFLRRRTMQAAVAPLNRVRASQPAEKLSPVVGLSSCLPSSG